jgi:uncharacterized protein YcbK (DUF882 family)
MKLKSILLIIVTFFFLSLKAQYFELGKPIKISSGFRCYQLNKLIGGSSSSQHTFGEAFDLELTDRKLFDWILKNIEFDQLIYEFGNDAHANWFHISYRKGNNRKQALRAIKIGGKTQYIPYKPL